MAKNGTLHISEIKEELRLIENSDTDYISTSGDVYRLTSNGLYLKKKLYQNKLNHYMYCGINTYNGIKTFRVHRLVAKAFIPNPNNYGVVGHKDNIKHNNCVDNLYWTTVQENTQKAVDDGLLVNAKGYDDSQSRPVIVLNKDGQEVARFGSVSECSRAMNVSKSTVSRWCKSEIKTKPRKGYMYKYQD